MARKLLDEKQKEIDVSFFNEFRLKAIKFANQ
jgi:hypothetical protein